MKCKLQQPVKDFMLILLGVIIFIGTLALIVMGLLWLVGYITLQYDVCVVSSRAFSSPSEVYLIQGIIVTFITALCVALLFASGLLLFLVGSFIKFIFKAIFVKGKERNWFKENIYNCEGN